MRSFLALSIALALSGFAFVAPAAFAGSCNLVYNASPYVCVSLDSGTRSEPGLCSSSAGHCGSPCVLTECVTQQTTTVVCFSAEADAVATVPICVPLCTACINAGPEARP